MLYNFYSGLWPRCSALRCGLLLFVGLLAGLSSCRWGTDLPGKYRLMEGDWRGALLTEAVFVWARPHRRLYVSLCADRWARYFAH
jgi:hypothetical protein